MKSKEKKLVKLVKFFIVKKKFMECRFIENLWLIVIDKLGNYDILLLFIEINY